MTAANEDSLLAAEALNRCDGMAEKAWPLAKELFDGRLVILPTAEVEALKARNAALEKVAVATRSLSCTAGPGNQHVKDCVKCSVLAALDKVPKPEASP